MYDTFSPSWGLFYEAVELMMTTAYGRTVPVIEAMSRLATVSCAGSGHHAQLAAAWDVLKVEGPPAQGTLVQDWQLNPDVEWRRKVEQWLDRYNGTRP